MTHIPSKRSYISHLRSPDAATGIHQSESMMIKKVTFNYPMERYGGSDIDAILPLFNSLHLIDMIHIDNSFNRRVTILLEIEKQIGAPGNYRRARTKESDCFLNSFRELI
jgi:hypothetical protein